MRIPIIFRKFYRPLKQDYGVDIDNCKVNFTQGFYVGETHVTPENIAAILGNSDKVTQDSEQKAPPRQLTRRGRKPANPDKDSQDSVDDGSVKDDGVL